MGNKNLKPCQGTEVGHSEWGAKDCRDLTVPSDVSRNQTAASDFCQNRWEEPVWGKAKQCQVIQMPAPKCDRDEPEPCYLCTNNESPAGACRNPNPNLSDWLATKQKFRETYQTPGQGRGGGGRQIPCTAIFPGSDHSIEPSAACPNGTAWCQHNFGPGYTCRQSLGTHCACAQ